MIVDSYVWRKELKKDLRLFEKYLNNLNFDEDYNADLFNLKFEKFFFQTAYIIRKLIEASKFSDEFDNIKIKALTYKKKITSPKLDDFNGNFLDLWEEYDLNNSNHIFLSINDICNYFVHSFIFRPDFDNDLFKGVFVNSTYTKGRECYYIKFDDYKKIILEAITDDIVYMETHLDRKTGKIIRKKSRNHIPDLD